MRPSRASFECSSASRTALYSAIASSKRSLRRSASAYRMRDGALPSCSLCVPQFLSASSCLRVFVSQMQRSR